MVMNITLKAVLQELAQITSCFYQKNLPPDALDQYPDSIKFIGLMKLNPTVEEYPLFKECARLMVEDAHINALNGKLVGTSNSSSIIQSNQLSILSFLNQLFVMNRTYDQLIFDKAYSSFEELFYSEVLRIRDFSRLNNFRSALDVIELGYGIYIRQVPLQRTIYAASATMQSWTFAEQYRSDFVMERFYDRAKLVRTAIKSDGATETLQPLPKADDDSGQGLPKTSELFDMAISALRISKPSAVFRDSDTSSQWLTFHPMPGGTSSIIPLSRTVLSGEQCIIDDGNAPELKKIFGFLLTEEDSRFNVAQRRLSLGSERARLEDRLLDYMIGLEALYLPDGSQELIFRLSLRASLLLFSEPAQRKETYHFLTHIYDTRRSKIVHGKKHQLFKNEIDELEELLRKSLKLWIEEKNCFSTNQLTSIFFK